jgi:hypothetical protein
MTLIIYLMISLGCGSEVYKAARKEGFRHTICLAYAVVAAFVWPIGLGAIIAHLPGVDTE